MVQTGGDCVGFLHSLQSVSIMHEVSISVVTGFFFSSGTKPTSHEQSVVQKTLSTSRQEQHSAKADVVDERD